MSPVSEAWLAAGERWTEAVNEVAASLQEKNPALRLQQGLDGNDIFPLRGWASFARGETVGDEALVISLDVKAGVDEFRAEADIARGDGFVLAHSDAKTIPQAGDEGALRVRATQAISELTAFLSRHQGLLATELAPDRP